MSTYFEMYGSTLSTCPDPSAYMPEPPQVVGAFATGKPVAQGLEKGMVTWNAITPAEYADLWGRWNTNKDTLGAWYIPNRAGTTPQAFRSVNVYAEEPRGQWISNLRMQVTMHITIYAGGE